MAIGMEGFLRSEDYISRHAIFQFSDIAGPFALVQELENFLGNRAYFTLEATIELPAQIFDEVGNIFAALSKWRKCERNNIDAVEKIGAKTTALYFLRKYSVRGADYARVHAPFFVIADAGEVAVLQDVQ